MYERPEPPYNKHTTGRIIIWFSGVKSSHIIVLTSLVSYTRYKLSTLFRHLEYTLHPTCFRNITRSTSHFKQIFCLRLTTLRPKKFLPPTNLMKRALVTPKNKREAGCRHSLSWERKRWQFISQHAHTEYYATALYVYIMRARFHVNYIIYTYSACEPGRCLYKNEINLRCTRYDIVLKNLKIP